MSAHKRNDLVWYLLLHQGVGVEYAFEGSRTDALERHVRSVNDMCHTLGITIVVAELIQSKKRQVQERYLFCFSDFVRNDGLAVRVAEAYEFAMGICAYPVWGPMDDGCVLRIPKNMVPSDHKISLNALVDLEKGRKGEDRTLEHPDYQLSCCCGSTLAREEVAWHLASLLLVREDLLRACRFWLACQEDVLFFPGDIEQALESYDMPPKTQKDQTRFETALQYAFKTVEAIIGDPPKNDSKFFDRLRNAGSDLY